MNKFGPKQEQIKNKIMKKLGTNYNYFSNKFRTKGENIRTKKETNSD